VENVKNVGIINAMPLYNFTIKIQIKKILLYLGMEDPILGKNVNAN
jgi:hypothetical protein